MGRWPVPGVAWTPTSQLKIAESAAGLAPPDLMRQIAKHRKEYRDGVLDAFRDVDEMPASISRIPPAGGYWIEAWDRRGGRGHRRHRESPSAFLERSSTGWGGWRIFWRTPTIPLNASSADRHGAPVLFNDFAKYLESAEPRVQAVFYGLRQDLARRSQTWQAHARSRPWSEAEGFIRLVGPGVPAPSVPSMAAGTSMTAPPLLASRSLCYSHAVSDVTEALRYHLASGRRRGYPPLCAAPRQAPGSGATDAITPVAAA